MVSADVLLISGSPKTWPAAAGVIFVIRAEQLRTTANALEYALLVQIPVFACKRALRSFLPSHVVLLRSQLFLPFAFRFANFPSHVIQVLLRRVCHSPSLTTKRAKRLFLPQKCPNVYYRGSQRSVCPQLKSTGFAVLGTHD
jgi:hypothetical protein